MQFFEIYLYSMNRSDAAVQCRKANVLSQFFSAIVFFFIVSSVSSVNPILSLPSPRGII